MGVTDTPAKGQRSDRLGVGGALVLDVAGVPCLGGLEQQNVRLALRDGLVLDAARDDIELALVEVDALLPKLDREVAVEHEEQLVGLVVVVPDELAVEFGEFDRLAVEFADELRRLLFVELGELRFEIDFLVFHILTADDGVTDK